MRQINIKELNKHLSAEMAKLPFAVTKRGKVIGVMIALGTTQGTDLTLKDINPKPKGVHNIKEVEEKLTEIVKKKQGTDIIEATIPTDGRPIFSYTKEYQARKAKK